MGENYIFRGSWIGADMMVEDRRAPIFKKNFIIEKEIEKAELFICGLGLFEVKINGKLPDDTVLNPAHTQYNRTVLYRSFDVSDLLTSGENEITVELGHSFFNETTNVWDWDKASWRSSPKLIADLNVAYQNGEIESIFTDDNWCYTLDGQITKNSIYYGETHDLRKTDFKWEKAILVDAPEGKLKPQNMPPIRRIGEFKPEKIEKLCEGTYLVTAPEMITGWAKLNLCLPKDTEIKVVYSENLNEKGYIQKIGKYEGHDGPWWPDEYIQQDTFIGNGELCELEPKFSYKGFRYIQIENCPIEITNDNIIIYRVANDMEVISEFECSNESVNKLHEIMQRTLFNNFQGKPTDTPVWEKNGWLGDFSCGLTSIMFNFQMAEYLKNFVDVMNDCFEVYGIVPVMVPSANWGLGNSPVWNTVYVFSCEALLDYCNEKEYVKALYPNLKKFALNDIEVLENQGWVWGHKGLADWLSPMGEENAEIDPGSSEGCEICGAAFIYKMLLSITRIAEILGETEDIELYKNACENIYKAFNEKFYNAEKQIYETTFWDQKGFRTKYRQTSNLLPLAFGMVPEENKKAVLENLVNDIIEKDYHFDTGCTGVKFVLPVLYDNGYSDVAYKVLTQKTYPSWCFWLENGATSAWESWETTTRSQDHYFLGSYDEAFFTHLAGIKDVRDGYRSFTVSPKFDCGLRYVKAKIKTPVGILKSQWEKDENGKFTVKIEIPEGSKAKIILPAKENIIEYVSGGKYTWEIV